MIAPARRSHVVIALLLSLGPAVGAAQTLETETARLLRAGWWKIGNAFEFQTSSDGTELAVPFAVEYGLTDNLELLVEPVPYTAIRPRVGRHARGVGDVEATLTYRFRQESRSVPALALAAEVKLPTARDTLIGTRRTDYAGYVIASKRFGHVDAHFNVGYTIVGQPAGVMLDNVFNFALAGVYRPNTGLELFGEVLGSTASGAGEVQPGSGGAGAVVPEAAGNVLVGTLGAGKALGAALLYLAVSYDNSHAVLFRPGLTVRFR